jgi:Ca2+-binding RTX toxin-like protein
MLMRRPALYSVGIASSTPKKGKLSLLEGVSKAGEALALAFWKGACMKITVLLMASMMLALLVAAGVALAQDGVQKVCNTNCQGTDGADTLSGTTNPNTIKGRKGDDLIEGYGGKDTINGNAGADAVYGNNGEDKLRGEANNDYVQGGNESDHISTGSGDDLVAAKDGFRDQIECGSGYDQVYVDRIDVLDGCEKKLRSKPQPQF